MNIAVLGGGTEGQAIKDFFTRDHFLGAGAHELDPDKNHVQIFDKFEDADLPNFHLEDYDRVFRSPSVHPPHVLKKLGIAISADSWTSSTRYFFDHCKAKIIGITGTKGKGTTCSLIKAVLDTLIEKSEWKSRTVHLVGNIGLPAISQLEQISEDDIVVFEMSSFQLWDLGKSPEIAVVLRVEPDHLDRHLNFDDYVDAKTNIVRHQTKENFCVYYAENATSAKIASISAAHKIPYSLSSAQNPKLGEVLDSLNIPGVHNRENAIAALTATACFMRQTLDDFVSEHADTIKHAFSNFQGLPHRLQFLRTLNNVDYYDDNYSSAFPATDVALRALEEHPTILIAGGKNRHLDYSQMKNRIFSAKNLKKIILIGEVREILAADEDPEKYEFADTLEEAVGKARSIAENISENTSSNYDLCIPAVKNPKNPVVLMSPGCASFDMFENFKDRGEKFQNLVKNLS